MISSQKVLLRIQLGIVGSYFLVKFLLRPFVLENELSGSIKIFAFSYPNFCEAVVGTIVLTFALLFLNAKVRKKRWKLKENYIPAIAVLIAGIYVVLQELKIHNLGGTNVYDIYDIVFSIFGLTAAFFLLRKIKPKFIVNQ